ncbi:MAG: hypothetical protein FJW14_06870 [Acidimicrobiia bacterium]|nr:hypothetical protein [Acidimicrobiia bacterium]
MKLVVALAVILAAGAAAAQGIQTGEIKGVVTDTTGALVPEVTVTLVSPALQGVRSTSTDGQGAYVFRGLAPGTHEVSFMRAGFANAVRTIDLPLGSVVAIDVALAPGQVTEEVVVSGPVESAVQQTQVSVNITKDMVDLLPIGRTPFGIASIMPGLTTNTPNGGQVTISGAFAYDTVFLVDGADINDHLFGSPDTLFIEDAIEETQVLTGGISAEYGRFSGGVINVVTRRGGNTFSGSFRETLTNRAWDARSPFEKRNNTPHEDKVNTLHEGTFGGPIVRDRLWFFAAARRRTLAEDETFPQTGIPYVFESENHRVQFRATATLRGDHTVSAQYLTSPTRQVTPAFGFTIDPAAIMRPEYPNQQVVTTYRGTLGSKAFAEAQYSRKRSAFRNAGGTSTDIVDSPIINASPLGAYNAPYFDATDPEDRDNNQVAGSISYFFSRRGLHDVKAGGEYFTSTNRGGNSQTATGYVFDADYLTDASGAPVRDASGRLIPTFVPGETFIENWLPVRGATIDIKTTSLYVRDRWAVNNHWSVDAGTRFELVRSNATGGVTSVDTQTIVPRLGVAFDPRGTGSLVFQSTYGHYAGKYNEAQFSRNTNVGNPDALFGIYVGPPGAGRTFAPGFNPANYVIVDGQFPTANVFFEDGLSSPVAREFTLQAGSRLGRRGYVKFVYANRRVTNFVEDFITLDTGSTTISRAGISDTFSNILYRNSDEPKREYQGLQLFGRYNLTSRWTWNAAWTVQLENDGNFEGEFANQPAVSSVVGDYPEAFNERRSYPIGRLDDFQRHALRVWSIYRFDFGRLGGLDVAGFLDANSAFSYSLRAGGVPLSAIQRSRLTGYASTPTSQTVYFAERGSERFKGYGVFDMAVTYSVPVLSRLRPWIKLEVYNLLNNDKLVTWNTTVTPDPASPLDELGLRTGYIKGPRFGQAQSNGNYPAPRAFQMAFGIRF